MSEPGWYVYIVVCRDGSLYTGVASDVDRRVDEHNRGVGAKYTRGRGPVQIVATSAAMDKREAMRLEYRVKRLPRASKLAALSGAR